MKFKQLGILAAAASFSLSAQAELIGVAPAEPLFNYNSGGTAVFTSNDGALTVNATPVNYTPVAGGTVYDVFFLTVPPSVVMNLSLDNNCDLVGGDPGGDDLIVTGDAVDGMTFATYAAGTLLTGEIIELGREPAGDATSWQFDARFAITGGELVTNGDYTVGAEVGVTLAVENNNFAGCMADWNGGAKGVIGAIETTPDEPPCFDVKKVKVRDGKKHHRHWGAYGKSKSKISAMLNTSCPTDFDPTASHIEISLDGESFEFPVGSFNQVGSSNKYRAWVGGMPSLNATLNCDKGRFSFTASKADTSQIDNSDGVDITLVLGDQTASKNVVLNTTGHRWWHKGHGNVLYYNNPNPTSCKADNDDDDSHMHKFKVRHKHTGKIWTFMKSKGLGKSCMVHDAGSGHSKVFDTSTTSTVTCGDGDDNFEVVGIDHKDDSMSCTDLTEDDEDDDIEDNQHDD